MTEKQRILDQVDSAIDSMDLDAVERGLDALNTLEPRPAAEDPRLFAARIQRMEREKTMRISKRTIAAAAAIAAVALTGFTAYAANALGLFTFASGDRYATVRTTDTQMTRDEAQSLALDNAQDSDGGAEQGEAGTETFVFASVQEASAAMGMPVVLPADLPELSGITAQSTRFDADYETRTVWVNCGDPDDRYVGVTVSRAIVREGADVTAVLQTEMDKGSRGTYRGSDGTVFTLFSESDPAGERTAHIAAVETGEYTYALVLVGYDEAEQRAMLDALDLSVYR